MKILVRAVGPMGETYGSEYGQQFFDKLWNKHLVSKLADEDSVQWFNRMPVDGVEFDSLLSDYDAVIGSWIKKDMITEHILSKHPNLKYIGTISHGYAPFDTLACKRHGVVVTNTVYNDHAVAQHTFALLLEICNNVAKYDSFYKNSKWLCENPQNNKLFHQQRGLHGKTFGIIGLGNIGLRVANIASAFGMDVLAYSRREKKGSEYNFIKQTTLEDVLQSSDVVSIHCPLTEETYRLFDNELLSKMKKNAILLNTARGEIIDEEALNQALLERRIYAAGLDVLSNEPLIMATPLLCNPYVVATEHIAWASIDSRINSIVVACANFFNWRNGSPTSVISEV